MKKILVSLFLFSAILIAHNKTARAQQGFVPELLGNASGVQEPGFAFKFFTTYFYQERNEAHDVEVAFEPQIWIPGFTGDMERDQLQFIVHVPMGYRRQKAGPGIHNSVTGIGTINVNAEYYWRMINNADTSMWFDNAITIGFPTATEHEGVRVGQYAAPIGRIGGNNYSIGWFQENMLKHKKFMLSLMTVLASWNFKDEKTNVTNGLSLNIFNGAAGFQISEHAYIGADFGLLLGRVIGAKDAAGNSLPVTLRAYAGPAALITWGSNISLQISTAIDLATRYVNRGQGAYIVLWYHF